MTGLFSQRVSEILAFSREEAARLASHSVEPEHLLLGILREREGKAASILSDLKADKAQIKGELETIICGSKGETETNPLSPEQIVLSPEAGNIIKLAVLEARIQREQMVDDIHLLLGLLHDMVNNRARQVLEQFNITYSDVVKALEKEAEGTTNNVDLPGSDNDNEGDEEEMRPGKGKTATDKKRQTAAANNSKTPVIDNFGIDLTEAARREVLDPVVGRTREMARIAEILGRRKKNNPVLIGEPGVGKSAIVEGLAQLIAKRETSPLLFNKRLVSLDMASLVAGTKYRGQFEERVKALLNELESNPDIIVFIDEIHTLVGAGSTPGSLDAANMMKPALARGTIQCIGATTLDEYRNIEKDGALERRFQKVMVEPTTKDETLTILHNIRERYERHHRVKFTDEALEACVVLTEKYVTDRHFPDKAIDALDESGSHIRLSKYSVPKEITDKEAEISQAERDKQMAVKEQNYELAAAYRDRKVKLEVELKRLNDKWINGVGTEIPVVEATDVAQVVSVMTGIPVDKISQTEGERLRGMAQDLKASVIAQDKAIDVVVRSIQRNRLGLKDPNRPIGVFMFLGPTGVGKTYLAKQLAELMFGSKDSLIRVDMSEYSEQYNVSRLVGAPPGYVGYEQGGQLTEKVRRHPYSIILLDEIEKAHGNVFNTLLQVFDDGRLTDGSGRTIDFRNTIIIMTSNTGTRELKDFSHALGFSTESSSALTIADKDKERARAIINKALSKRFAPEFLNRIDEIVMFDQLDQNAIRQIIDLELAKLIKSLENMGYGIRVSPEAKDFLALKGYDIQYGARPLKRAIQANIEDELGELIINGTIKPGNNISVNKPNDKDSLSFDII